MYYLKIREDESNSLNYYCRNCGHEDATLTAEAICVSETQLRRSEQKYTHMVNEYTKFDPTLPRINSIKCPNQECISNGGHGKEHGNKDYEGGVKKKTEVMAKTAEGTSKADPSKADSSKADPSKADPSVTKKKTLTIKKTAKTLAKEAEESAKEAKKVAKEVEAITMELIAEEEEEEEKEKEKEKQPAKEKENNREVIYIRYDDINMKYVYLCVHCDTTWKTDNRM